LGSFFSGPQGTIALSITVAALVAAGAAVLTSNNTFSGLNYFTNNAQFTGNVNMTGSEDFGSTQLDKFPNCGIVGRNSAATFATTLCWAAVTANKTMNMAFQKVAIDTLMSLAANNTVTGNLTTIPIMRQSHGMIVGNGTLHAVNGMVEIDRTLSGLNGNMHGYSDFSIFFPNGGGSGGDSYDSNLSTNGAGPFDHIRSYQSRLIHSGSGTLGEESAFGVFSLAANTGAGTVTNVKEFGGVNPSGAATKTNVYGFFMPDLTNGTNNWAIFTGKGKAHFGDRVDISGNLTVSNILDRSTDGIHATIIKSINAINTTAILPASSSTLAGVNITNSWSGVNSYDNGTIVHRGQGHGVTENSQTQTNNVTAIYTRAGSQINNYISFIGTRNFTTPGAPAGTTSTTGVMTGLLATLTPKYSDNMTITVSGDMASSALADGVKIDLRYQIGNTCSSNGIAITGTTVGNPLQVTAVNTNADMYPFSITGYVTGLTGGTKYCIELGQYAITAGTATITNLSVFVTETQ
jgi:hypothetical protein